MFEMLYLVSVSSMMVITLSWYVRELLILRKQDKERIERYNKMYNN